ncbi:MAG TPA: hypothetical protein VNY05_07150 [Candidatus Acidoferrales bacterium]|jgi:hypothetical protein|nr:hypothetical protein [Candidatus Acidoferrales bacterium]
MLLLLAALPALFWDGPVDTAPALRDAGIKHIQVPAARLAEWKNVPDMAAEAADLQGALKLPAPTVNYRMDQASASRAPWLTSNGWQFLRQPKGRFYYDATGKTSALAAAEAFCFGANVMVRTDAAGLKPLAEMLEFLGSVNAGPLPPIADIGFIDDGSEAAGEVMNLMVRDNLLFEIVARPDPRLKLTVRLGATEYPLADAKNPSLVAHVIRGNLTDEKRSVRIYGSPVVVARLTGSGGKVRLHLLNYTGATRNVDGIRVRVLGQYPKHQLAAAGSPGLELADYSVDADATEFTLTQLKTYAVIDLSR